jgi:hypothetical protein
MNTKRVMLVFLLGLLLGQDALAFYNAQAGRWLNRDPINESGFKLFTRADTPFRRMEESNPYLVVRNRLGGEIDALGLLIYKCSREGDLLGGGTGFQHVYLWSSKKRFSCGMGGDFLIQVGTINKDDKGPGTKGHRCVPVPGSECKEQEVMDCCLNKRTHGWILLGNTCHNFSKACLDANGLPDPDTGGIWIPGPFQQHIIDIEDEFHDLDDSAFRR